MHKIWSSWRNLIKYERKLIEAFEQDNAARIIGRSFKKWYLNRQAEKLRLKLERREAVALQHTFVPFNAMNQIK